MCRCVLIASAALRCNAVWYAIRHSAVLYCAVLCCATSPFLVVISELLKVYRRRSARYQHVLGINIDNCLLHMPHMPHMPHMLPVDSMESFQTSLTDQALTSFYSWHPSVLSLCKSLMTVIWVACIAPSNMLRTDYIMFIRRLCSHILHNTAFRGVGLMNQIWFFVDNGDERLHPDPTLHYATSCLNLADEETQLFCPTLRAHRVLQSVHHIWDVHKYDAEVILSFIDEVRRGMDNL